MTASSTSEFRALDDHGVSILPVLVGAGLSVHMLLIKRIEFPVSRMAVDPGQAVGSLSVAGVEYQFCSLHCVRAFAAAPEDYVA